MTITIKKLRTSSAGLEGTYKNADHHAKPAIPLIDSLVNIINGLGKEHDFEWKQGNNVHILTAPDGRAITMRPFISADGEWGIDVLVRVSNKIEVRLFAITQLCECMMFGLILDDFFYTTTNLNTYGSKEHRNNSRAED